MSEAPDPGEALLTAVAAALPDLEALLRHGEGLGPDAYAALRDAVAAARTRLGRRELHVVVVGEQKSGKSTFLNAMLGERLLGAAVRECTATVTRLRHAPARGYVARFVDGHVETRDEGDGPASFAAEVRALTDQAARGAEVAELDLYYPARHLPPGLVLVDTPGVNTAQALHADRAWRVIREEADGIWLVSDLQQALSSSTREFLQAVRPYVPHAFLVLSKVDRALANAEGLGEDPAEQVEEARRLGVRRFAKELDRKASEVFAVAVAAERALEDDSPLAAGFGEAVETLLALAQTERAIVLGARAAHALRQAIQGLEGAGEKARALYEARLDLLEAQRIPRPDEFRQEQLARVTPRLVDGLRPLVADAQLAGRKALARQGMAWQVALRLAIDEDALRAETRRLGAREADALGEILEERLAALRAGGVKLLAELEDLAFEALRERYRVAQTAMEPSTALVLSPNLEAPVAVELGAGLLDAVVAFDADRLQLGLGGAAAGAALGSLVMPGVGTLVGAALGSLAAFFVSLDDLRADCLKQLEARMTEAEARLARAIDEAGRKLEASHAHTLDQGLRVALARYEAWIEERLAAQREAIATVQADLADLQARRDAIAGHARTLETLVRDAEEASRGLARSC